MSCKEQEKNNEFKNIYALSGNVSDESESSEDFIGSISLEYNDWNKRRKSKVILNEIINQTKSIKGIKVETREDGGGPPSGKPINIKLTSSDKILLLKEAFKLKEFINNYPKLINIEDNFPAPGIDWEINVSSICTSGSSLTTKFNLSLINFFGTSIICCLDFCSNGY